MAFTFTDQNDSFVLLFIKIIQTVYHRNDSCENHKKTLKPWPFRLKSPFPLVPPSTSSVMSRFKLLLCYLLNLDEPAAQPSDSPFLLWKDQIPTLLRLLRKHKAHTCAAPGRWPGHPFSRLWWAGRRKPGKSRIYLWVLEKQDNLVECFREARICGSRKDLEKPLRPSFLWQVKQQIPPGKNTLGWQGTALGTKL